MAEEIVFSDDSEMPSMLEDIHKFDYKILSDISKYIIDEGIKTLIAEEENAKKKVSEIKEIPKLDFESK